MRCWIAALTGGAEVRPGAAAPSGASQRPSPACARWARSSQRPESRFSGPTCIPVATGISPSPTARPAKRGKRARTRAGISRIPASSRRLRGARGGSGPRTRAFPGLATRNRLIASAAMSVVVLLRADTGSPTTTVLAAPEQSITRTQKSRRPTPALSELDEWQKRSRRPSALPFTDGQAQAARPHFTGIDAQAFTRRRRRRRRPPPSSRTDR